MKMPYDRLIKQARIKEYKATMGEVQQLLKVASRDLNAATNNLAESPDWAYTMAYNAVLQTGRALMLSQGFRPRGSEQHATVVEFVKEALGGAYENQTNLFDQMRRKRHRVIYEVAGLISKNEAEQAVNFSKEFVKQITMVITKQMDLGI
jgi:uncharacterized protein (UPF0332 family)